MAARQSASTVAPRPLPERPNLNHLKKLAKTRLKELRRGDPRARLTDAQLKIAREHGFPSWRKLKVHVETMRQEAGEMLSLTIQDELSADVLQSFGEAIYRDRGDLEAVRRLHGSRATLLHMAAWQGDLEMAKLLVSAGADLHAVDEEHKATPLGWAQTARRITGNEGCDAVAAYLEEAMAATRSKPRKAARGNSDWKPIMDAAFAGDVERVRSLLDAGADPNVVSGTAHRYRPLHRAIEVKKTFPRDERHEAVVKLLLERGADPTLRGGNERLTALQLAAIGETRFVPMLLEHFRPLDLFHACVVGDEKRVAALLKRDRSLASARDSNEWQALHYCAASRMHAAKAQAGGALARVARKLIEAGADPMEPRLFDGKWPLRPLYDACGRSNNAAVAEVLLSAGADPCDGESVYHASDEGHAACLSVIEKHVRKGKLAAECTKCLRTQMRWGRTRGMKWLLAHGADPNAAGEELGNTALHWAAANGASAAVIQTLLEHGADPSVRNKAGKTPLDLARAAKKKRVGQQLFALSRERSTGRTHSLTLGALNLAGTPGCNSFLLRPSRCH